MSWTSEVEMFADVRNVTRARSTWARLASHLRPYASRMVGLASLAAFGVLASVGQPFLFREALNEVVSPGSTATGLSLGWLALLVLAVGLLQVGVSLAEQHQRAALTDDITSGTRDALIDRLQRTGFAFFVHANPGAVFQRIWDESGRAASSTVVVLSDGPRSLLIIAIAPLFFALYSIRLAVILLVLGVFLLPSSWIRRRVRARLVELVSVQAKYAGQVHEAISISGAVLTRMFGLHEHNRESIGVQSARHREVSVAAADWQALNQTMIGIGLTLAMAAVIWVGGNQVEDGNLSIGDLALLLFFLRIIAQPLQTYSQLRFELIRGFVAYGRLFEVLDVDVENRPQDRATSAGEPSGELIFEDVSFSYPTASEAVPSSLMTTDQPLSAGGDGLVLQHVSFTAPPGAFVALVGSSGSGKSTVAALASGLYDAAAGRVAIGGVDVRSLDRSTVSRSVAMVTQDTHLLHDTIRNNLLLARPDASDKDLVKACIAAGIHRFIRALPNGYGTIVGERGVRLSGGQRQRLAFARILLRDPAVVILDEATAHLDAESEGLLREAVSEVLAGRTRIVIAHRLSTIVDADEILVLEAGRIVERGDHRSLLAAGGRYHQLYGSQFFTGNGEFDANGSDSRPAARKRRRAAPLTAR